MRRLLLVTALFGSFTIQARELPPPASHALPRPVAQQLAAVGIPQSAVAVMVEEAGHPSPRIAVNSTTPMNPASVMKVVTTYGALEMLGPAYTWKTDVLTTAPLDNGVQGGDLYLRGSGDPKLTADRLWLLMRQLRGKGLREIRGDLVLDRSAFATVEANTNFDDQPLRPYNVVPDALLANFKALRLTLVPEATTQSVRVVPEVLPDNIEIANQLKLGGNGCGEWRERLQAEVSNGIATGDKGRYRITLSGSYPLSCGEKIWNMGVLPHDLYVLGLFRTIWRELGGELRGSVRNAVTPANANVIASTESPTLAEVVRDINKFSNNVMARQLFLTLSQERPATTESATASIRQWLTGKGINAPELILDNGSGLSRKERISAATLVRLLQKAHESALMPEFVASLPLSAVDGTMKKRLGDSNIAGHAHIKTGTLEGVKTIAGYVQDAKGREQIVVFLVNHPNASRAQAAQDALLQWVYEGR
ncbi:MAG TPA: D-alanyl-D-alanine carboxypeptidase/D-alanyl-D-alanine-endopeptidase [Rhodocyclaceae bacterium]|nr:D-alanyl-D-alanine carboxypeptidase/D-alanyl-D-alanine-endopeptidase [Rhodocyclaceae bacterium]